ncbi:MAG: hypothetical protein ABI047_17815 [Jatrophihabitantaceae bacterium]
MADTRGVSDELYAISPARRRRMALALAPLGLLLLVTGILAASLDGLGWKLVGLLVAALAVVLLAVAWGLRRSAALSEAADAERRLDEVLAAAAESSGANCAPAGSCGASWAPAGSTGASCASAGSSGVTGLVCDSGNAAGGCATGCLARSR